MLTNFKFELKINVTSLIPLALDAMNIASMLYKSVYLPAITQTIYFVQNIVLHRINGLNKKCSFFF